MQRDACAGLQRGGTGQEAELHFEPRARRDTVRCSDDAAARNALDLDALQVQSDARARQRALRDFAVELDPADPRGSRRPSVVGPDLDVLALFERRAAQRAGDDGAEAAHRERAIHRKPGGSVSKRARRRLARGHFERIAELVEAAPGHGRDGNDRRAGKTGAFELLRHLELRELEQVRIDRVGLGQRDDAAFDPEQVADRQVLAALRHDALVGRDHEEHQIDSGRAGHHRVYEPLVPGHVDQRELKSRRQDERRETELDRDPARLLLGQPVAVDPGQRAHERGLAVIDVPRGAKDERVGRHPIRSKPVYGTSALGIRIDPSACW